MIETENFELPIVKENASKTAQRIAYERRIQIRDNLVKILGFRGAKKRIKELAKVYKISERQIYKDFDWIKGNFEPSDLREVRLDLKIARNRALEEALNLLQNANTPDDKAKAITILMNIAREFREEMEAWDEKPKVPEKLEVKETKIVGIFSRVEKNEGRRIYSYEDFADEQG
jgi:hypothetical protein